MPIQKKVWKPIECTTYILVVVGTCRVTKQEALSTMPALLSGWLTAFRNKYYDTTVYQIFAISFSRSYRSFSPSRFDIFIPGCRFLESHITFWRGIHPLTHLLRKVIHIKKKYMYFAVFTFDKILFFLEIALKFLLCLVKHTLSKYYCNHNVQHKIADSIK